MSLVSLATHKYFQNTNQCGKRDVVTLFKLFMCMSGCLKGTVASQFQNKNSKNEIILIEGKKKFGPPSQILITSSSNLILKRNPLAGKIMKQKIIIVFF